MLLRWFTTKESLLTFETFDRGIWVAILISETSSVISGLTASFKMKQRVLFLSFYLFLFQGQGNWTNFLLFFYIQIACLLTFKWFFCFETWYNNVNYPWINRIIYRIIPYLIAQSTLKKSHNFWFFIAPYQIGWNNMMSDT